MLCSTRAARKRCIRIAPTYFFHSYEAHRGSVNGISMTESAAVGVGLQTESPSEKVAMPDWILILLLLIASSPS